MMDMGEFAGIAWAITGAVCAFSITVLVVVSVIFSVLKQVRGMRRPK